MKSNGKPAVYGDRFDHSEPKKRTESRENRSALAKNAGYDIIAHRVIFPISEKGVFRYEALSHRSACAASCRQRVRLRFRRPDEPVFRRRIRAGRNALCVFPRSDGDAAPFGSARNPVYPGHVRRRFIHRRGRHACRRLACFERAQRRVSGPQRRSHRSVSRVRPDLRNRPARQKRMR